MSLIATLCYENDWKIHSPHGQADMNAPGPQAFPAVILAEGRAM